MVVVVLAALVLLGAGVRLHGEDGRQEAKQLRAQVAAQRAEIKRLERIVYGLRLRELKRKNRLRLLGAGSDVGNLFIDPTGGTCSPTTTLTTWRDASGCTPDQAAAIWKQGDVVVVKGGTYGGWVIPRRSSFESSVGPCNPGEATWAATGTAKCVEIVPALGETPLFTSTIEVHSSSVWVHGTRSGTCTSVLTCDADQFNFLVRGRINIEDSSGAQFDHDAFEGVQANGYLVSDSHHVLWRDSSLGGVTATAVNGNCAYRDMASGQLLSNYDESKILNRNAPQIPSLVVFDSMYFHDTDRDAAGAAASCHFGGMIWASGTGITMRDSTASQLWVYFIEVQIGNGELTSTPVNNVTLENNNFACDVEESRTAGNRTSPGQISVQFSGVQQHSNWLVRGNSFGQCGGIGIFDPGTTFSGVLVVGNDGKKPEADMCSASGVTYTSNAFVGGTCGGSDTSVSGYSELFTSTTIGAEDFHLVAGSPAIDAGSLTSYPATDVDGETRYTGAGPEAGADETSGATPPPPPTTTGTTTTAPTTTAPTTTAPTTTASTTTADPCADGGLVAPSNLAVFSSTRSAVTISWTAPTSNVTINKLVFYRDGVLVSNTGGVNRTKLKFSVAPPSNHELKVEARDVCGRRATGTLIVQFTGTGWVAA